MYKLKKNIDFILNLFLVVFVEISMIIIRIIINLERLCLTFLNSKSFYVDKFMPMVANNVEVKPNINCIKIERCFGDL